MSRFEVKIEDYQKEIEEGSGYEFASSQPSETMVTVVCTPRPGVVTPPLRIEYHAVHRPLQSEVIVHASIRDLSGANKFATRQDTFSFKASARMSDVNPWIALTRMKQSDMAHEAGLPKGPASAAFSYAMPIVWAGVRIGLEIQHEKKSRRKDIKDGGLFDVDAV